MSIESSQLGLLQVLIATGALTAMSETVRWFLGRGKTRVDDAKVVQGMALDLLTPLREELARSLAKAEDLGAELDSLLAWAVMARALLDAHHIAYPPVPQSLRVKDDR